MNFIRNILFEKENKEIFPKHKKIRTDVKEGAPHENAYQPQISWGGHLFCGTVGQVDLSRIVFKGRPARLAGLSPRKTLKIADIIKFNGGEQMRILCALKNKFKGR